MGVVIFVTGIPSSGKTTVSRRIVELDESFQRVEADAEIRRLSHPGMSLEKVPSIFRQMLRGVLDLSQSTDVVVDASMPAAYVAEARELFGDRALFVSLRITENERRSRERSRGDREPIQWNEGMTSLGGAPELYDLVIQSSTMTPDEAAAEILEATRRRDHEGRLA